MSTVPPAPNQQTPEQPAAAPAPGQPITAPAAPRPLTDAEERQWASLAHLGGILGFIPALIIWLVFKDRGPFTSREAKEALNFQITIAIVYAVCTVTAFLIIPGLIALAAWVVSIIFAIIGFTKGQKGIAYRYPFALRLIK